MQDWERCQKIREAYRNAGLMLPTSEPLGPNHYLGPVELAHERGYTRQTWSRRLGPANCGSLDPNVTSAYLAPPADDGTLVLHRSWVNSGDAITRAYAQLVSQMNGSRGGRPRKARTDAQPATVNIAGTIIERRDEPNSETRSGPALVNSGSLSRAT